MQCPVLQCFEEMAGLYADIPPSREPEEQQQGQGDGDGQDGRAGRGAALEIKHLVINDGTVTGIPAQFVPDWVLNRGQILQSTEYQP